MERLFDEVIENRVRISGGVPRVCWEYMTEQDKEESLYILTVAEENNYVPSQIDGLKALYYLRPANQ